VFTGGRVTSQIRVAEAGRRTAEVQLASTRAQLLLDVTQAYYDAVLADRLVGIAEATLRQADTTLQQTRLARQVGNQPEFELLRAQVTFDNQRPVVIQRRSDRQLAYTRLALLLNLPLDQPLSLTTPLNDAQVLPVARFSSNERAAERHHHQHRAPVRQAAAAVEVQEAQLRAARSQRFPQLSVFSQYARVGYPAGGLPDWNDFRTNWNVGAQMSVPIFTGGRLRGDQLVAEANLLEARARLEQTRSLAQLDTRTALERLDAARASWEASQGTVEQAGRAYQIAEIRYREGLSTQTELADSRILLQQAEANRAQAARDLQIAQGTRGAAGRPPAERGVGGRHRAAGSAAADPAAAAATADPAAAPADAERGRGHADGLHGNGGAMSKMASGRALAALAAVGLTVLGGCKKSEARTEGGPAGGGDRARERAGGRGGGDPHRPAALRRAQRRARGAGAGAGGRQVLRLYADQGQAVRAGQPLARIDAAALSDAPPRRRPRVRSAQTSLEVARRNYERARRSRPAGAMSDRDLEASRNQLARRRRRLAGARAQLASAQEQLSTPTVRSPISGVVEQRPVSAGDVVQPGTALFTMVDPHSMRLEASVPADQLGALRPGSTVRFTVNGYPGAPSPAPCSASTPRPTRPRGRCPWWSPSPTGGALVAGLFAEGRVESEVRQGLMVPATAIDERGVHAHVLRLQGGKARARGGAAGRARPRHRAGGGHRRRRRGRHRAGGRRRWAPRRAPRKNPVRIGSGRAAVKESQPMFISDFAIKRPVVTVVTMLALVVFGIFALFNLEDRRVPRGQPPVVVVSIPYPGASPETSWSARWWTPWRRPSAGISGVDQINSRASTATPCIIVQFVFGKDLQQATQDIRDAISQIRNDLPPEMKEPILSPVRPERPADRLAGAVVASTLGSAELTRIADPGITRELRAVNGVAEVPWRAVSAS
jgi:RND family efflux transporter MFP subunit